MRIAIIGSRGFNDEALFLQKVQGLESQISGIISGGAKGADTLAANWAATNNIPLTVYLPDWKKYGRSAGIVRNKLIIDDCEYCLVFWDTQSYGTKFSIDYCYKQGKPIRVVEIPLG